MEIQIIQIDLINRAEITLDGYERKVRNYENNRVQIIGKSESSDCTYYINGVFYGEADFEAVERKISELHPDQHPDLKDKFDGEFNIIIWNRVKDDITIISDQSGTKKLFYNYTDGVVTITSRLIDQAKLQSSPAFSEYGIYTALVISYTQDPYTFLDNTWATRIGELTYINKQGKASTESYYNPVDLNFKGYSNINESVNKLDEGLKKYFKSRISKDTTPVVMLSGGIDSVVMMSYLHDDAKTKLNSVTFAIEGSPSNELTEARIAADYYQSAHHELMIDPKDILNYTISGFLDYDAFQLGNMYSPAIQGWIKEKPEVLFDIFRGEDTRLHTPFFDFPFLMGLMASRKKSKAFKRLWNLRKILNYWPIRFGRNYLKYAVKKSTQKENIQTFLLQSCLRFNFPVDSEKGILYNQLLKETEKLQTLKTMDDIHRGAIECAFNIQYSEDNKNAKMASVADNSFFLMPFLHPDVVRISNNIPYKQSSASAYVSPKKTRSYFFMLDKIVLRKLMKGRAPEELLYRRKTTAPNNNYMYDNCWQPLYKPLLENYSDDLINHLKEKENKDLLSYYIKRLLKCDGLVSNDWGIAWNGSTITGLIILLLIMQKKVDSAPSLKKLLLINS